MKKGAKKAGIAEKFAELTGKTPFAYFLILTSGLVAYIHTVGYTFSPMDDYWLIQKRVDFLSDISNLPQLFREQMTEVGYSANYYRPVLNLSFMLEAVIAGKAPWMYHLGNIMIHLINGLLVFVLLKKFKTGKKTALFLSVLFMVHPVNAQAVAWIPGRSDTLMALFLLLSFIFFIRFFRAKKLLYIIPGSFFMLAALLTKETAIIAPVILLVWYFSANRGYIRLIYDIVAMAGMILSIAVWYILRIRVMEGSLTGNGSGILSNALNYGVEGFLAFTGKAFYPLNTPLTPFINTASVISGIVFVMVILIALFYMGCKKRSNAIFGAAWFLLMLLPPLLVKGGANEHWIYPALPGFMIFLASVDYSRIRIHRTGAAVLTIAVLVLFVVRSHARSAVYKDYDSFLDEAIDENPGFAMYYDMRGTLMKSRGHYDKALRDYSEAIEINPGKVTFRLRRATLYASLGEKKKAWEDLSAIISRDSMNTTAYYLRAGLLGETRQYREAIQDLDHYIRIVLRELGSVENPSALGNLDKRQIPDNLPAAFNNRGIYHYYLGNFRKAEKNAKCALSLGYEVSPSFMDSLRIRLQEID